MNKYTDQEFTYRETPVSYDGIAKLDSVKGNTIAWNQLEKNDASTSTSTGVTFTNNGDSWTVTGTPTGFVAKYVSNTGVNAIIGHKYLFFGRPYISDSTVSAQVSIRPVINGIAQTQRDYGNGVVIEATTTDPIRSQILISVALSSSLNLVFHPMIIDLTMLGMDDVTDKASFQKYFSLPYYSYNSGTLVNFSGNGIKVTGKNILKNDYIGQTLSVGGVTATVNADGSMTLNGTSTSAGILCWNLQSRASNSQSAQNNGKKNIPNGTYYLSGGIDSKLGIQLRASNTPSGGDTGYYSAASNPVRITIDDTYAYNWLRIMFNANKTFDNETIYPMVRYENADSSYEPYTETITDLPISTYFPNGLKSAGDVHDELTPSKAVTKVGSIDLGSMSWTAVSQNNIIRMRSYDIKTLIKYPSANNQLANMVCAKYTTLTANNTYDGQIGISCQNNGDIYIYDSAYTDATAFTTAMSGVMLNYELATPTEQDINADLFYKFYGDGTEAILPSSLMNGSVNLGSLTWGIGSFGELYAHVTDIKYGVANVMPNMFTPNYPTVTYANRAQYTTPFITLVDNTDIIQVRNTGITDATAFKNSVQGVMLWYEKSDSTPSTSAFFGDIIYYNAYESEVPYRKFWMVNSKGERWNLTEKEVRSFLNNPQGLGFSKTINTTRYGNAQVLTDITDNFPSPSGEVLFYDSHNSTRYEQYNEFVKFISYEPVTLYYKLPFSFYSQIPNVYTLECVVGTLTKTESKNDNLMTCPITFNALSYYQGEEVNINGTGTSYTIQNDGDFPVGFEITLEGSLTNPYITLEQDGDLYGEAKFDDSTAFSSVYVNSNDGEQNVVLEQGGSILPNPLSYQDLSISNGSIYVTFVKLARGESTLTIGMDSGSLTSATIKFAPIYRSV